MPCPMYLSSIRYCSYLTNPAIGLSRCSEHNPVFVRRHGRSRSSHGKASDPSDEYTGLCREQHEIPRANCRRRNGMFYSDNQGHHGTLEPTTPVMIFHRSTLYHPLAQLVRSLFPFLELELLGGEVNLHCWYCRMLSSWTSEMERSWADEKIGNESRRRLARRSTDFHIMGKIDVHSVKASHSLNAFSFTATKGPKLRAKNKRTSVHFFILSITSSNYTIIDPNFYSR
jgi:hypothetical protein